MFKKILIANRGEIALRIIRTAREMGIKTVAIYSTADRLSLHVRFADEAVCIGPPLPKDSYLNIPHIVAAAEITNVDAIHPGYGFLSENSYFSSMCTKHGIKFIGASSEQIQRMGDKYSAKETMKKAGVPCVPGPEGIISSYDNALDMAQQVGYPIMLKASSGGGGKGMRAIWNKEDIKKYWDIIRQEAKSSFGNDNMYMEKLILDPRHIEIQVVGDQYGNTCHLSERDCSIQRRHQKLIEEAPSPFITETLREKIGEAAIKAASFIEYEGVGTIEFLVDKEGDFYFMEMNTRIQVEHPITEEVIGYDLIREQILLAFGEKLSGKNYYPSRYSIECRINAEDPYHNFRPIPGKIIQMHTPGGQGIRVDTHAYAGYVIPPYYDSMIAKLITTARSRDQAISKMRRALDEFVIEGIQTTIPFHRQLMHNNQFLSGNYTTKFLDSFQPDLRFAQEH